ncbi:hypothetical protein ACSXCN_05565 [Clostridium perfringens]
MAINKDEINEAICKFKGLNLIKENKSLKLVGNIKINNVFNDVRIIEDFCVEITIPNEYPLDIPTIKEVGGKIDRRYHHINYNGTLCLATETEIKLEFNKGLTLIEWIERYVIPYLFSYCYYKRYNVFPFGERSHGMEGIFEFYKDLFEVDSKIQCINLLNYICNKNYRGHDLCPCNSGRKVRSCHRYIVIKSKEVDDKKIFKNDLYMLSKLYKEERG